ncbi:MAG: TerB family tellurite resistance protein [Acetobacter sp.]|nr:TerB family tellurite resistance protein [Acetobacter sp.]
MCAWGKIFGGVAGFAVGGPAGAAVGLALGHAADKGSLLNTPTGGWHEPHHFYKPHKTPDPYGAATFLAAKIAAATGKKEALYGLSCIILCAKLAKCDGAVNRKEIDAFKRRFPIPLENRRELGRLFDTARQRTDDYEAFARNLGQAFRQDPQPLEDLLGVLFMIARADLESGDDLTPEEEKFLKQVHRLFGLSRGAWERAEQGKSRTSMSTSAAYSVLGVKESFSDEELRTHWKSLVRQYHPDMMTARGASVEEIEAASLKIAAINAAWDIVRRDRGL